MMHFLLSDSCSKTGTKTIDSSSVSKVHAWACTLAGKLTDEILLHLQRPTEVQLIVVESIMSLFRATCSSPSSFEDLETHAQQSSLPALLGLATSHRALKPVLEDIREKYMLEYDDFRYFCLLELSCVLSKI